MATATEEAKDAKPRIRKPAQGVADEEIPQAPPAKVKTTIELSWETHQRLALHSLMLRKSNSTLVEELINAGLRRFSTPQDRGGVAATRPGDAS